MGRSRENYQDVEDISSHKERSDQERYQFERRYPTQALETQEMDFSSVFGILLTICVSFSIIFILDLSIYLISTKHLPFVWVMSKYFNSV